MHPVIAARRRGVIFGRWVAAQLRDAREPDDDVLNAKRELEARRPDLSTVVKHPILQERDMSIISKLVGVKKEDRPEPQFSTKPYLRIKIISLALEAQAIRRDEVRWIKKDGRRDHPIRMGLMAHRKSDVRPESRCAQLAYAFLRGRKYSQIESKESSVPNWLRISELAAKYGPEGNRKLVYEQLKAWRET